MIKRKLIQGDIKCMKIKRKIHERINVGRRRERDKRDNDKKVVQ